MLEDDKKPSNGQESEKGIKEKDEALLADLSKKLFSDDEGSLEGLNLTEKEEQATRDDGKDLYEAMLAEQQEENGVQDMDVSDASEKASSPFEGDISSLEHPAQTIQFGSLP